MADTGATNENIVAASRFANMDPSEYVDHPSGFLAMSSSNRRFMIGSSSGFIAYRDQGRHRISLAGVLAPRGAQVALLDAFLAETQRQGLKPLLVQLPQHQVQLCVERGMTVNQLGATFILSLEGYSLRGTRKMKLRNKIKRGRDAGMRVVELGVDRPWSKSMERQLNDINERWLRAKRKKELQFMVGELGQKEDGSRRIFVVQNQSGTACGFITYVPAWCRHPGYLHDLSRRDPSGPVGMMELCNAFAIERMIQEGVKYLHFGFTPFVASGDEPDGASRLMAKLVGLLRRHGHLIYPAESQAHYKLKWGIDIVAPEYIAARPLSFRAIYDLMRLTRSL
jgi:lysylphosphatidylglycerol synthetase-like protein (DUF2156 family)